MDRTPNARLKAFFDSTTLSVREFATEIGKPNGYRTLYQVFNGNRDPSSKLVKSIIRRFPQLSYDWVFVGAGEMILPGGNQMKSLKDNEYSVQARFEQTMDRIDKIDHAMNELANRIERAMSHQAEMTNIFFTKIDEMTSSSRKLISSIEKHEENVIKTNKNIESGLIKADTIYNIVSSNGKTALEIAEDARKMTDSYWNSVGIANEVFEMMKEIKKKL